MLDDLIELVVDIGGEVIGALVEHRSGKAKKRSAEHKKNSSKPLEPWEHPKEKPVWEE